MSEAKKGRRDFPEILSQLEALAVKLGVTIRYENLRDPDFYTDGGSCRVKDEKFIIVHKNLSPEDRAAVLARELGKFPLEDIYLSPLLRTVIQEEAPEIKPEVKKEEPPEENQ